ncbi:MAG: nuclear transport factor 2 family protein [Pyrinomonadaceae bacterium]
MKRATIFVIALLLIAATNAFAQTKLEQEFIERHRAEEQAEAKRDIAALERMFAEDFVFIAANGAIYDKKKFIDEIKADTGTDAPQKLDYENFKVRTYGKTAMVNYVLVVSSKDKDGKDTVSRYRMSVFWLKQKGMWKISNFHSTRVRG